MCGKYSLTKFANFLIIVLRAKVVNTIMRKFANFVRLYPPHMHYNIFQPNFRILLLLKGSFREFRFYCLDQKLYAL